MLALFSGKNFVAPPVMPNAHLVDQVRRQRGPHRHLARCSGPSPACRGSGTPGTPRSSRWSYPGRTPGGCRSSRTTAGASTSGSSRAGPSGTSSCSPSAAASSAAAWTGRSWRSACPCPIDARIAAIVFAISGSIVEVWPLLAASAIRFIRRRRRRRTGRCPCSDEGLMTVGVSVERAGRADPLVVDEEERLVLDDRPADPEARLVLVDHRLRRRLAGRRPRCGAC